MKSYEFFCTLYGRTAWPVEEHTLAEWITARAIGSTSLLLGRVKATTITSYVSALRSIHVDRKFLVQVFETEWIKRILDGVRRMQPFQEKKQAMPVTHGLLTRLVAIDDGSITDLNLNTAFKVAFAGFLRSGEFTYSLADVKSKTFPHTGLTRSDITFGERDQYAVLRLKRSKTDVKHEGVEILLAATYNSTCPVAALRLLFERDPKSATSPLYSGLGNAFDYKAFVTAVRQRLVRAGVTEAASFSGHSFRRGASQQASDNGMLESDIQKLGRWTSNAFKLYFTTSHFQRFNLSLRFQKGIAPSFQHYHPTPTPGTATLATQGLP